MTATEVCYPPIKEEHLPTDLPRELWGPRLPHPYRWYYKGLKTEAHYDGNMLSSSRPYYAILLLLATFALMIIVATIKANKEAE